MAKYDPNKTALENFGATCPACDSEGTNRIWVCGSFILSGEFVQGEECRKSGEVVLVESSEE